jgi:ribose-phosphate pyrophosphokinase
MSSLKIFPGDANRPLAQQICDNLSQGLGDVALHQFPSGEHYCQFKENIRGKDVFLIQPLSTPVNENLMQLLIMVDAARRSSADRITVVIPYLGYSRQDRKDKSRTPISVKLVLDMISAAGVDRIISMDLHAPQINGMTNLPFDHLYFSPVLIKEIKNNCDNCAVVAPDVGALKRASIYSKALKCNLAIINKERLDDTQVSHTSFIGDVKDKKVFIVDDITESCGTLIGAAKICKEKGAKEVVCAVTHPCLTRLGLDRLEKSLVDGVIDVFYNSDTVRYECQRNVDPTGKIKVLSVAGIFSRAIRSTHENESISELFKVEE